MRVPYLWDFAPPNREEAHRLARGLQVSPITAQILLNRGIDTTEAGQRFLADDLDALQDPFGLPDMRPAVERLAQAVRRGETVLVYGDYDVDGSTSGALLVHFLQRMGARPLYYVPHRVDEGYGLHDTGIDKALEEGARLIVTVDCGTTALEPVAYARRQGVDVIVTDHHEPSDRLPDALAVVNPKRRDRPDAGPARATDLAGVGVAFKLACALAQALDHPWQEVAERYLDLVALGTVADVVPLKEENRLLVSHGLRRLQETDKIGLQRLISVCRLDSKSLAAYHVAFMLAPRLNAAGRMDHAMKAFDLLTTQDGSHAEGLARHLDRLNRDRQEEEGRILEEALRRLQQEQDLEQQRAIVLASPTWHIGVVGIVASRLVERFYRPTVLIALEGDQGKGSARSIPGFPLHEALEQCGDVLIKYGGHAQAAGLTMAADRVEEFRERLDTVARKWLQPQDLCPRLAIDALVAPAAVSDRLYRELEALAPFGMGNPRPVLACRDLDVRQVRRIGAEGKHLKMVVEADGGPRECVAWRKGDWADALRPGDRLALAFSLNQNEWNGQTRLQLEVKDLRRM